jgi:DNA-binding MarR family transcriptional regulator
VPDRTDRRVVHVRLSEKGRALTRKMLPRLADDLEEILAFMPKETLNRLSTLLDDVRHGLAARSGCIYA